MGRVWDILTTIERRVSEVKEELQTYRKEIKTASEKGTVRVEGLQRLIAEECPEQGPVLMALLALQVALEHGSEIEIFNARKQVLDLLHRSDKTSSQAGKYRLAPNRQTDFVKIMSTMYDDHMFVTDDGLYASNKLDLMCEVGTLFQQDLSKYSSLISKAKASSSNYLQIFDKLRQRAHDYYYDNGKHRLG